MKNKNLMLAARFLESMEVVPNKDCSSCGKKIDNLEFKTAIAFKEYSLSGLCQTCQDEVFGRKR